MAYEWIKVEVITPDKPEVHRLAEILSIDPDSVLGKLIRIWAWADQQTIDGNANGNAASVTKNAIDRIAFLPGFADALLQVGWLKVEANTLVFPNFDRHNGKSSKKRILANRRVTEHREKGKKSNAESVTPPFQKALPEEEREEEVKDKTPLSGGGENLVSGVAQKIAPPARVLPDYQDSVDIPIGKFTLYAGWVPSTDFQKRAALWGRVIVGPPPGYSLQELAAFTAYWGSEGKVFNHVQWEQKFADSVLYERRQESTRKSIGGSNATTQQTTSNGESRAMQRFREAQARRHGSDAGRLVGSDDRDLHGSLDSQERDGTVTSLDGGDWSPDE